MNNTATKFNVTVVFSSFMYGIAYFLCKPPAINTGSNWGAILANIVLVLLSVFGIFFVISCEDFLIDFFSQMGNLVAFSVLFFLYAFSACAIIGTINEIIGEPLSFTYRLCVLLIYGIATFFAGCSLTEDSRDNEYSVLIFSSLLHIPPNWRRNHTAQPFFPNAEYPLQFIAVMRHSVAAEKSIVDDTALTRFDFQPTKKDVLKNLVTQSSVHKHDTHASDLPRRVIARGAT